MGVDPQLKVKVLSGLESFGASNMSQDLHHIRAIFPARIVGDDFHLGRCGVALFVSYGQGYAQTIVGQSASGHRQGCLHQLTICVGRANADHSHPEVRAVVLTGALDRVFCAGANIVMLRSSAHAFKVNFCKYTNETRLGIEEASDSGRMRFLAALNGTASGGGYELALACDRILLVDDRNSAVSFPEVPLLGVLPGTGGLTRITDKRKLRRDRCDVFSTVAEGIKGKRAVDWNLVDAIAPLSRWDEAKAQHAAELAAQVSPCEGPGVQLPTIEARDEEGPNGLRLAYQYVRVDFNEGERTAELTINAPETCPADEASAVTEAGAWWATAGIPRVG